MSKKGDSGRRKSKSKEPSKNDESEDSWVFDSLVGFLRGPVWCVPVMTFIEQKSLVFEPEVNEENEKEYKTLHGEYKNLVDFMLGSYMEDLGINSEQFEKIFGGKGKKEENSELNAFLFEQVWAADDYVVFKRMMIQKNIDLQLQALELLKHRYGILPPSLQDENGSAEENEEKKAKKGGSQIAPIENEKKLMDEIKKKSKEEHKSHLAKMDKEKREMEEAIANSLVDQKRLEAERDKQRTEIANHFKSKSAENSAIGTNSDPNDASETKTISKEPASQSSQVESMADAMAESSIDPDELRKRTEFLKEQRDKLLAMKKAEREKQLAEVEQQQLKSRPKSARAARSALKHRNIASSNIDAETLKARQALAEKLKHEVIGAHND